MALIRCPECNKKISSTVSTCPKCGYQISSEEREESVINGEKEKPKKKTTMLFVIIASSIALLLLIMFTANANFGWFGNDPTTPKGMIRVKSGSFLMRNMEENDEYPVYTVNLTHDYWIGKKEITFNDYDTFCNETGRVKLEDWGMGRGLRPAFGIDWWDAVAYCNWLSKKEGLSIAYLEEGEILEGSLLDEYGYTTTDITRVEGYRLPTEAEWEYAARGGQNTKGYKYAGSNDLNEVGWYKDNSGGQTHPVGQKLPNELGLYDMSGNVIEWCHDWYGGYASTTQTNPTGPRSGSFRVVRGGSWGGRAQRCRVAHRGNGAPVSNDLGFRVARTVKPED